MPAFMADSGMPLWAELRTPDYAAAQKFYSALFGWEFEESEPGYYLATLKGMPIAGIIAVDSPSIQDGADPDAAEKKAQQQPAEWMLSFYAADVEDMAERARTCGYVVSQVMDGPRGPMVIARDPAGAPLGFIEPASEPFVAAGEPGTPLWHELAAFLPDGTTIDDLVDYYTVVLGWDVAVHGDAPEQIVTAMIGGEPFAGIWFPGAAGAKEMRLSSSRWTIYYGVTDVDAAVHTAEACGGSVYVEPQESAFGRVAIVSDPSGAAFTICEAPELVEEPHEGDNIFG